MSEIRLRPVEDADLPVFFEHQRDPESSAMAAVPARGRAAFERHWAAIRRDESTVLRTVLRDGEVAGNLLSWNQDGARMVGYRIGREHWGRGVAHDRPEDDAVAAAAAEARPVCVERGPVARGNGSHRARLRVALVLEEDRQVGVLDRTQPDLAQAS